MAETVIDPKMVELMAESCVGKKVASCELTPGGQFFRYTFEGGTYHDWPATLILIEETQKATAKEPPAWPRSK